MVFMSTSPAVTQTEYHNTRFTYDPRRAGVSLAIAPYLKQWIHPDSTRLEMGASYGEFTMEIRAAGKWALDQNPALQKYWDPSVRPLFQSAMDRWPIADGSLGTVFASNFFEHFTIEDGAEILAQARRTLRPGGRLIAIQPNFRLEPRRYFDDYTHKTAFTDNGFQDFLRAMGWRIVRSEPRFVPFTMKSRFPSAEWLVSLSGQFLVIAER
jgi:SAM-dependent methyltransferase